MTLLAIDTATPQVSVALWSGGLVAASRAVEGRRHGEILAPAIRDLAEGAGVSMNGLSAVAVDVGPGLFTGLRVGVATAKALVSALDVPAFALTSLDILAHPRRHDGRLLAAVVDARRGEVFRALYRSGPEGLEEVEAAAAVDPARLATELAGWIGAGRGGRRDRREEVLVVGDGGRRYAEILAGGGIEIAGPEQAYPDAEALAELAALLGPGEATDAAGLQARYLRGADVRIGWAERPGRTEGTGRAPGRSTGSPTSDAPPSAAPTDGGGPPAPGAGAAAVSGEDTDTAPRPAPGGGVPVAAPSAHG